MRRYTTAERDGSLSENAGRLDRNHATGATMIIPEADGTVFSLKTCAGILQYKAGSETSYTDFLRVVFEMTLSFNGSEVDPEFKKVIHRALKAYEYGDSDASYEDGDEEDEREDFVAAALEIARKESEKCLEADEVTSNLPDAENFKLRILSVESDDTSNIERIFSKKTDMPPPQVHDIIHNRKEFTLPADKAKDLYVQLRILDVVLSIRPDDEKSLSKQSMTTKKGAAAKTTVASRKTNAARAKVCEVTGREKLPSIARIRNA
jgi:hypothetical protein